MDDALLSLLINNSSDIIIVIKKSIVCQFNQHAADYFNFQIRDVLYHEYTVFDSTNIINSLITLNKNIKINDIDWSVFNLDPQMESHVSCVIIGKESNKLNDIKNSLIKVTLEKEAVEKENKTISRYLQDIISAVPGSIYWKNKEGTYIGCNEFISKPTGLPTSDIIGKTDFDLWPNDAQALRDNDEIVMKYGVSIRIEEDVIFPCGRKAWFIVEKMPLRDEEGNLKGIIGNSVEITELKETQQALELANGVKTQFIANMSHDIRTPLTGVIVISEVMENTLNNPQEKEYARLINDSGKQLLNLLDGILDGISGDNLNDKDLKLESFDFPLFIQDIIQLELPAIKAKNLDLKIRFSNDIPKQIICDKTKLHRILLNLLGNAIKFTQKGHVGIEIDVLKTFKNKAQLRFSIIDTGTGIPDDLQSRIFDRYFQVNSPGNPQKGHGIGLNLVQSYVSLLGGEIKLISKINLGSRFYFDLLLKTGISITESQDIK